MLTLDATTYSGESIYFRNPYLTNIKLIDLKYAASNMCLYGGHIHWELVRRLALCSLLSDYYLEEDYLEEGEALINAKDWSIKRCRFASTVYNLPKVYLGDVNSGLKKYLPDYREIEFLWRSYIWSQLTSEDSTVVVQDWAKQINAKATVVEVVALNFSGAFKLQIDFHNLTDADLEFFQVVKDLTLDECWENVKLAIKEYQHG